MKRTIFLSACMFLVVGPLALAQSDGQKSHSSTMEINVSPKSGQDASQQSQDEDACYDHAVQQTGIDPYDLKKEAEQKEQELAQAEKDAEQVGKGAGAKGAVKGAAKGAVIGEVADNDAGKGAKYGAGAGAVRGRRHGRKQQQQAEQQVEQQTQQAKAEYGKQMENFKKAFSVCLEAKDYMVK